MSKENSKKIWTIIDLINWSENYLKEKKIDDAKTSVEWMLTHILKCSRIDLYLNFDKPLESAEMSQFKKYLIQCANHKPVQQIIGQSEFYGLKIAINDSVLIPRPETERLVENVLTLANSKFKKNISILDIGSGSGAISIALAFYLPSASVDAVDISQDAVDLMIKNTKFHNMENRIQCIQKDIFSFKPEHTYDIIVSNPPYISNSEMSKLHKNVSFYEPKLALTDENDGLDFYRYFSSNFKNWLQPEGFAAMEFGGNHQSSALKILFKDFSNISIIKDYQNDDRILIVNP